MTVRRFMQVDVFSTQPTGGNGLAVVVEAEGLSDAQMQAFAAWTNLAETTFLLPPRDPGADYLVRIFTPAREMLFAGHPTLGSCMAWLKAGGQPATPGRVMQECGVGLVEIDVRGAQPAFVAPPTACDALPGADRARLEAALGLSHGDVIRSARLENGPVWQVLELADAARVLDIDSGRVRWPEYIGVSVLGAHPPGADWDFEVRSLSPSSGMSEDPITGSLNAALGHWLQAEGRLSRPLTMRQGTCVGRAGRVSLRTDAQGALRVGGAVQILIDGTLTL